MSFSETPDGSPDRIPTAFGMDEQDHHDRGLQFSPTEDKDSADGGSKPKVPREASHEEALFVRRAIPDSPEQSSAAAPEVKAESLATTSPSPSPGPTKPKRQGQLSNVAQMYRNSSAIAAAAEEDKKKAALAAGAVEMIGGRGGAQAAPPAVIEPVSVFQRSVRDPTRQPGGGPAPSDSRIVTAQRSRVANGPTANTTFNAQVHSVWRRYVDRLYDFYAQHFLEFPTSTVSFVPDSRTAFPAEYARHQIYTGTVSPTANYLCAYHCYVPSELDDEDMEEEDAGREYGKYTDVANVLQPVIKVAHDGPIQRLRANPVIPSLVACRGRKSNMSLYQLADYGTEDINKAPTSSLRGPRTAGNGLAWNAEEHHMLAATANDGMVYVYDVNANVEVTAAADEGDGRRTGNSTGPIMALAGHQDAAYDVSWHPTQPHTLMSCDAAGKVIFWDTRSMSKEFSAEVHIGAALSCAFHPTAIFAFATAGADGLVRAWDFRKLNRPTYNLVGHRGGVLGVKWAPFSSTVMLSHSLDGSVICWDLSKADIEPLVGIDDHARPEMVFQHFGHMGPVRDAQWCDHSDDPWTVVSVDDHNTIQLWSPAPNAYNNMKGDEDDE